MGWSGDGGGADGRERTLWKNTPTCRSVLSFAPGRRPYSAVMIKITEKTRFIVFASKSNPSTLA